MSCAEGVTLEPRELGNTLSSWQIHYCVWYQVFPHLRYSVWLELIRNTDAVFILIETLWQAFHL